MFALQWKMLAMLKRCSELTFIGFKGDCGVSKLVNQEKSRRWRVETTSIVIYSELRPNTRSKWISFNNKSLWSREALSSAK